MKHIKTTTRIRRPEKAQVPVIGDLLCEAFPDKDKCD